jgi:hypothetical protein
MSSKYFVIVTVQILWLYASAQEKNSFQVNPGEKPYRVIPPEKIYEYPSFINSTVFFRNSRQGGAMMNYNALFMEMEFIDGKGDTLLLDQAETIRQIVLNQDTFYFDEKKYVKEIYAAGQIRLAIWRVINMTNRRRVGSMGQHTDASVDAFSSMSMNSSPMKNLVANEVLTFKEYIYYFLGNKFGKFRQASRKALYELFGRDEKLDNYLKEHNPDLNKEKDLKKLVLFLNSLEAGR